MKCLIDDLMIKKAEVVCVVLLFEKEGREKKGAPEDLSAARVLIIYYYPRGTQ
jgi:hypothetical protein